MSEVGARESEETRALIRQILLAAGEVVDEHRKSLVSIFTTTDTPIGRLWAACEAMRVHMEPVLSEKRWDPDYPGCAPETCGGSRLDPCTDVLKSKGRTHDILGDEMEAAGLDRNNQTLRYAVIEEGSVNHYLAVVEAAAHEAKRVRQVEVPVSQLVSGDSVYSPSTQTWHEVLRKSGQLYFERDGKWKAVSFGPDVLFLTRRGDTGAAAGALFDALGGEVIEG